MHVLRTVTQISEFINQKRIEGINSIGLVPTMGALHSGHLSLVNNSLLSNDLTVVSIFVNPTQFNNKKDFEKYPITTKNDVHLLTKAGCDVVFMPTKEEMYSDSSVLKLNFGYLDSIMEGSSRPGHFSGVGTIVSKLLNIVKPNKAYFGQKDLQQVAVIKELVKSLSFQVTIVSCEIERDDKGLALSSRNSRLSKHGLNEAQKLNILLKDLITTIQGTASSVETDKKIQSFKKENHEIHIEYLKIVDSNSLQEIKSYNDSTSKAICIAAFIEDVRLIDNMIFE